MIGYSDVSGLTAFTGTGRDPWERLQTSSGRVWWRHRESGGMVARQRREWRYIALAGEPFTGWPTLGYRWTRKAAMRLVEQWAGSSGERKP